jgi:hypothetical protein
MATVTAVIIMTPVVLMVAIAVHQPVLMEHMIVHHTVVAVMTV